METSTTYSTPLVCLTETFLITLQHFPTCSVLHCEHLRSSLSVCAYVRMFINLHKFMAIMSAFAAEGVSVWVNVAKWNVSMQQQNLFEPVINVACLLTFLSCHRWKHQLARQQRFLFPSGSRCDVCNTEYIWARFMNFQSENHSNWIIIFKMWCSEFQMTK